MAYDKVVDSAKLDADLITVANKIRSKTGTNESLDFPTEWVSEIDRLPSLEDFSDPEYEIISSTENGNSAATILSQSVYLNEGESLYIVLDAYKADGTENATDMWDSFYNFQNPSTAGLTVSLGGTTKATFTRDCFSPNAQTSQQGKAGSNFIYAYSYTSKNDMVFDSSTGKVTNASTHLLDNLARMTVYLNGNSTDVAVHGMGPGWLPGANNLDLGPVAFLSQSGWSAMVAGATSEYVSRPILIFDAAESGEYVITCINNSNPNNMMYLLRGETMKTRHTIWRYVALGDSIPDGMGVSQQDTYPWVLTSKIGFGYDNIEFANYSLVGDNTAAFQKRVNSLLEDGSDSQQLLKKANIITICIGGNNFLEPISQNLGALTDSAKLQEMADEACAKLEAEMSPAIATLKRANPNARIVVMTIYNPYIGITLNAKLLGSITITSYNIGEMVDPYMRQLNDSICKVANEYGCVIADVYATFAADTSGNKLTYANSGSLDLTTSELGDGFSYDPHPTAYGHSLIVNTHLPFMTL